MKHIILISLMVFNSFISIAQHAPPGEQVAGSTLSSSQWLEDINFLQRQITSLHPDPFYKNDLTSKKFDSFFTNLRSNIPIWDENKIVTEIARIITLLHNGHSQIDEGAGRFQFTYFPILLYWFPEGIFAIGAKDDNKNIVGKKLVSINNIPIAEICKRMRPIISGDYGNEATFKDRVRFFLTGNQFLRGLDIVDKSNEAIYTFEDSLGKRINAKLSSGFRENLMQSLLNTDQNLLPLYRRAANKNYWSKYLESKKMLYIKYNIELNDSTLLPADFCRQMQPLIDNGNINKVVLDLRQNSGGNIGTLKPVYEFLLQPKINQYGKLYVLIDRWTESAGAVMAIRLSMISKAIIIGEPVVTAANFFDNPNKFDLPNSQLKIRVTTHFLQASLPIDTRTEFTPDIPVEMTAKAFFTLKDPLLEYAVQHVASKPNNISKFEVNSEIGGMYYYSPFQVLQVRKTAVGWRMVIEDGRNIDFLNTGLYPTGNGKYQTDINGVTLSYNNNKITLNSTWGSMSLEKLPANYLSLQQLVEAEKIDMVIGEIKKVYNKSNTIEAKEFETKINAWGYQLLNKKVLSEAIKLFQFNTELFPSSANAWDSLGEVYFAAGNKSEAIRCYNKALEIIPGLISATKAILQLQQ